MSIATQETFKTANNKPWIPNHKPLKPIGPDRFPSGSRYESLPVYPEQGDPQKEPVTLGYPIIQFLSSQQGRDIPEV